MVFSLNPFSFLFVSILGFVFIGKKEKQKQEAGVQSEKTTHIHTPTPLE